MADLFGFKSCKSKVKINHENIDGIVPIENGGTGATTANDALESLGINLTNLGIDEALANYQPFVNGTFSGDGEASRTYTLPITPRFILLYLKNQPPAKYDATNEYTLCSCGFAVNGGVSSIGISLSGNKLYLTQSQSASNGVFVNLNKYLSQYSYIAFK